jgi:LacI family transcriptional regulator
VSNTLNHPELVSPARREAVEAAIGQLGYVRHEAARHLRSGYSRTLGLMLLDAWNPGFIEIAQGVEDMTASRGWTVLISNSARDPDRERSYLRLFAERRLAGLIVIPHEPISDDLRRTLLSGTPVVMVDRAGSDPGMSVAVDDVTGGALAAEHLIDLGHRHIAFVGDETAAGPVHNRLDGVRKAVAGSRSNVRLDVIPADLTVDAGRAMGKQIAAISPAQRPTAVVAAIDPLAFGLLQALLHHGVRVPEDVSLVGYDDVPDARHLSVPLTSVRRPHRRMGTTAADMLTNALSGEVTERRHVVFQPDLVVRQSTGAPDRANATEGKST